MSDQTLGPAVAWTSCALVIAIAVVVALASTTGVGLSTSWFDEQRVLTVVVLALAALCARALLPLPAGAASVAVLAMLWLGLVSSLLAVRPFVAAVDWSVYCLIALLSLSARSTHPSTVETTAALVAAIVPGAYVTGVMANYVSALLVDSPVGAETLLVGFSNPRFSAQLQVLTIPLLSLAMQRAPTTFWRVCLAAVAALWWMCFIGSGSRTGWIAILMAAIVAAFLGAEGRRWIKLQLAFAVCGALLWGLLFHLLPAVLAITSAPETGRLSNFSSVGSRWKLWQLSVEAAVNHPLLGLGPMHLAYVKNGEGAHPHNFWLQLAAEWGIPAAVLITSVTAAFFVRLLRTVRMESDVTGQRIGVAVLTATLAWFIGSLADGYMVVPTSQAMSTCVLMLAVMWLRGSRTETVSSNGRLVPIISAVFCVLALAVLAVLPATEFGQPTKREQTWRKEHPGEWMWPRFWQQGWIGPMDDPSARRN